MKKLKRETRTDDVGTSGGEPEDPILSLMLLPSGPTYRLDDLRKRIVIGADEDCHIVVVDDDKVSGQHCVLFREQQRLFIMDSMSKNRTRVSGLALTKGMGEMRPGSVLAIGGHTELLACGRMGAKQERLITAASPTDYFHDAKRLYGSGNKAADAYEIPRSSFKNWLKTRFGKRRGAGPARKAKSRR